MASMKPLHALCLLLLAAASAAQPAEDQMPNRTGGDDSPNAFQQTADTPGDGGGGEPAGGGAEPAAPLTLEDVKANITTVIEAFFAKRSTDDGYFPLRDRQTKKLRRLKLVKVEERKTREDGDGLYSAPAVLSDEAADGARLKAVFTVNFKGAEWTVEKMRLVKAPSRKAAKP